MGDKSFEYWLDWRHPCGLAGQDSTSVYCIKRDGGKGYFGECHVLIRDVLDSAGGNIQAQEFCVAYRKELVLQVSPGQI